MEHNDSHRVTTVNDSKKEETPSYKPWRASDMYAQEMMSGNRT